MKRRRAAPAVTALAAALVLALLFGPSAVTARDVDEQTRAYALRVIAGVSGLAVDADHTQTTRGLQQRDATCARVLRGATGWLCLVVGEGELSSAAWLTPRLGGPVTRIVYRSPAG